MTTVNSATLHNPHEQSLAMVSGQSRVSGFEFANNEHISNQPSDLGAVADAQLVTTNTDAYVPQPDIQPEKQQPPPKRIIDVPNPQQQQPIPSSNSKNANNAESALDFGNAATSDFINSIATTNTILDTTNNNNKNNIDTNEQQSQSQSQSQNASAGSGASATATTNPNDLNTFVPAKDQMQYDSFFDSAAQSQPQSQPQANEASSAAVKAVDPQPMQNGMYNASSSTIDNAMDNATSYDNSNSGNKSANAGLLMGSMEQNPYSAAHTTNATTVIQGAPDVFSGLGAEDNQPQSGGGNVKNGMITSGMAMEEEEEEENEEQKQAAQDETFLSVWQAQHREMLANKAAAERETKEKLLTTANSDLQEFVERREARILQARKDAQSKENDLREEYNSVFQHGTIWQQVAKLVDLTSEDPNVARMKDLLIRLKNQQESNVSKNNNTN